MSAYIVSVCSREKEFGKLLGDGLPGHAPVHEVHGQAELVLTQAAVAVKVTQTPDPKENKGGFMN